MDTSGGYVKLFRSVKKRGILKDGPLWQLLGWAFIEAPWTKKKAIYRGLPITLEPGEIPFTQSELGKELGLSGKQVRGAIERGKRIGIWEILRSHSGVCPGHSSGPSEGIPKGIAFSVLKLVNFTAYQGWKNDGSQQGAHPGVCPGHSSGGSEGIANTGNPDGEGTSGTPKKEERRKKKERKSPGIPPEAVEICDLLIKRMRERDPKAKGPRTEKARNRWESEVEKINRIDGRSWREIQDVLEFSQKDKFWQTNIRSGEALRKYYERVRELWTQEVGKERMKQAKADDEAQARRAAQRAAEVRESSPMPESTKSALVSLGLLVEENDTDGE